MPLIHITTCLLCADRKNAFRLEEPSFETSDVVQGQVPQRLAQFHNELLGHIQKAATWEHKQLEKALKRMEQGGPPVDRAQARHFQAWIDFQARTMLAQGTAVMNAYETTDPALLHMREVARLRLNQVTRTRMFTDEMIRDAVLKMNMDLPDDDLQDSFIELIKGIRDALLEEGKYAPQFEQPARVIA